jgi:hypothetical protein
MLLKSPSANSPDPSSGPVTTPHASKSAKETSFLRVLLLITLTVTGLTAGGLCYYFIRHSQKRYYESEFFGMVNDHFKSTKNSFKLLLQANVAVATSVGETCPSASDWPNCEIASRDVSHCYAVDSVWGYGLHCLTDRATREPEVVRAVRCGILRERRRLSRGRRQLGHLRFRRHHTC